MDWVLLIPALPAAAFFILLPLPRSLRNRLIALPVAAMAASFALALAAFARIWPGGQHEPVWSASWTFARMGTQTFDAAVALDPLAAATLVTVTLVATCVQVYSLGYMHKDERIGWYYAVLSLFTTAMLVLVLSANLLFTFAMWELMGLCSYLLIGFWYELEAPRKASQKAFLTTRVGDLGFLIALFVIFVNAGTFDLHVVLETLPGWAPGAALIAAVGLLWAAMGKSAQVPLHVWLPDAMAGPTPASALIHAATMVAAGVFVVARTLPIFEQAPGVMTAMLVIGAVTALLGGLLAAVQHDVKKVLAYSTISQLGLMFVALGAGSATAALFHLTTHAFFKSLLFLGAGVIIHSAHTQDMREMGGLAKRMPITTATFAVGALALAGVPPLAGFFSKDEILAVLLHEHHYATFAAVIVASGLTAFYVTRLWFRVFTGPEQSEHLKDGHRSMLAPMVVLAVDHRGAGLRHDPLRGLPRPRGRVAEHADARDLDRRRRNRHRSRMVGLRAAFGGRQHAGMEAAFRLLLRHAHLEVLLRPHLRRAVRARFRTVRELDDPVRPARGRWRRERRRQGVGRVLIGSLVASTAAVIDGAVNGLAGLSRSAGRAFRRLQTGRLQSYQRLVIGAVVVLMLILVVTRGA